MTSTSRCLDPLADAITVLSNVKIENPSDRVDTEDASNRVALALDYLAMIGTYRAAALIEGIRDRTDHPHALELLNELERLVTPKA